MYSIIKVIIWILWDLIRPYKDQSNIGYTRRKMCVHLEYLQTAGVLVMYFSLHYT